MPLLASPRAFRSGCFWACRRFAWELSGSCIELWIAGLVPRMLTFSGANVDIYIGASAALIAWISTRGRAGMKVAFAWNGLGLLALANVVVRSVLTAPGPLHRLHTEVPNRMLGTFPYLFIPGFFVPLAIVLHLLAIRAIVSRLHPHTEVDSPLAQHFPKMS